VSTIHHGINVAADREAVGRPASAWTISAS
jgi:hypothetical protein